jgi:hypothetical protein
MAYIITNNIGEDFEVVLTCRCGNTLERHNKRPIMGTVENPKSGAPVVHVTRLPASASASARTSRSAACSSAPSASKPASRTSSRSTASTQLSHGAHRRQALRDLHRLWLPQREG